MSDNENSEGLDRSLGDMPTLKPDVGVNDSIGDMPTVQLAEKSLGQVDRYELLEKLGEGGFGAVYSALDTEAQVIVALKSLPREIRACSSWIESYKLST